MRAAEEGLSTTAARCCCGGKGFVRAGCDAAGTCSKELVGEKGLGNICTMRRGDIQRAVQYLNRVESHEQIWHIINQE